MLRSEELGGEDWVPLSLRLAMSSGGDTPEPYFRRKFTTDLLPVADDFVIQHVLTWLDSAVEHRPASPARPSAAPRCSNYSKGGCRIGQRRPGAGRGMVWGRPRCADTESMPEPPAQLF